MKDNVCPLCGHVSQSEEENLNHLFFIHNIEIKGNETLEDLIKRLKRVGLI